MIVYKLSAWIVGGIYISQGQKTLHRQYEDGNHHACNTDLTFTDTINLIWTFQWQTEET